MEGNTPPTGQEISAYKKAFLQDCITNNVLSFGTFTLKSGRQSPYFFNAGAFHTARLLSPLASGYAHAIQDFLRANPEVPQPDVLFGPAYKGIPIAVAALMELHRLDPTRWEDVGYSFNRKEKKDHGEGGGIVGASLKDKRVLVLDDVLTAGTAMRETMKLVTEEGGKVVGFLVALDRLEVKPGGESAPEKERVSAMGELRREWGVKTASIATLDDLIQFLKRKDEEGETQRLQKRLGEGETQMLEEYRRRYGTRD